MTLTNPMPFAEALQIRAAKKPMPTGLSSAELARLDVDVRERAMFSARVLDEHYLDAIAKGVQEILNPVQMVHEDGTAYTAGRTQATVRTDLRELLQKMGYQPSPEDRGTLKDFSSDARLNVVIETNVEMAQGYGQWAQGMSEGALDEFPALELYRLEDREVPRDWATRWTNAAKAVDPIAMQVFNESSRMVATKDSPIWTAISDFGQPYPPFAFGSGMWTRSVNRDDAIELGVIVEGQQVQPQQRPFAMEASA